MQDLSKRGIIFYIFYHQYWTLFVYQLFDLYILKLLVHMMLYLHNEFKFVSINIQVITDSASIYIFVLLYQHIFIMHRSGSTYVYTNYRLAYDRNI